MAVSTTRMDDGTGSTVGKAAGFDHPTQLPRDETERRQWQAANKAWWDSAPMRYDWRERIPQQPGSAAYFEEIDRRFFASARAFMPWGAVPFDAVIPFDRLAGMDVLEVGVGQGTHAQLLASRCRSFTGIDLTAAAATMTARRLQLLGLPGSVLQMDVENMAFADESFDFVWSWGVVHHCGDARRGLAEIARVLRPGGRCTVMVYYRSWWNYGVAGFVRAAVQGRQRRFASLHHASQTGSDGAIARYYKPREWRHAVGDLFDLEAIRIYGLKSDIVPLPHGRLKQAAMTLIPDALARAMTRHLRMGSLLVAQMRKRAD
jgi:SAM-dependent methyltransferase